MNIQNDPYFVAYSEGDIRAYSQEKGLEHNAALARLVRMREAVISRSRLDPYRYSFEPDMWLVARALLGRTFVQESVRNSIAQRTGMDAAVCWETWRDGVLNAFGLSAPVTELLILGGNGTGKTDFASKLAHEVANSGAKKIMISSQKREKAIEVQMDRMWRYMPREQRVNVRSDGQYAIYTKKNGFSNNTFINKAECKVGFTFYSQEKTAVFEGSAEDAIWFDELYPVEWVNTAVYRVSRVGGFLLKTFTPIGGWTESVERDLNDMRIVHQTHAYVLPIDGGDVCPWHELGLTREEYDELMAWEALSKKRPDLLQSIPSSRPHSCVEWYKGVPAQDPSREPTRNFRIVPRAAVSADGRNAVLWFHPSDNPFSKPYNTIAAALSGTKSKGVEEVLTRVYGMPTRRIGSRFKFDERVHVVDWGM